MSVIEEKKALRTYIRQTERTLDPAYKAESSEAICRCVLALEEYRAAGTVFAFAGTVHEIDTALLLKETLAAGKTLVLPRCAEGHALDLCVVTSMDELVPGMYGILEPKADCALVTPADIDFAVVPCLSFDRRGRRLGQGGGYYDRLLPQLACPTCLICRERLMSEAVPTEEHDRARRHGAGDVRPCWTGSFAVRRCSTAPARTLFPPTLASRTEPLPRSVV